MSWGGVLVERDGVRVRQSWKIIGAGDLTGDGKGEFISRDTAGRAWMNPGNGAGGFGDRTALGAEPLWPYAKIS